MIRPRMILACLVLAGTSLKFVIADDKPQRLAMSVTAPTRSPTVSEVNQGAIQICRSTSKIRVGMTSLFGPIFQSRYSTRKAKKLQSR